MKRIGILGGTFDPPHLGHLIIAQEVKHSLSLDEIWFIPTYEPPHKDQANTDAYHRVEMLKAAIHDNHAFHVNLIEIKRLGKSYTLDTIQTLKREHPNHVFYFIIGADMVEYLPNWYKIDELLEEIDFVGVKRSGYQLKTNYPIIEVDIPTIEISSTQIRKRLAQKENIRYLIPALVQKYIEEYQLYGKE